MTEITYGFVKTLARNTGYDDADEQVTAALQEEGFGVLTTIDVRATLRKKLDVDFRPYLILGACNPTLAHQALQAFDQIGLLLPCNAVVQDTEKGVIVSLADPKTMFQIVDTDNPKLMALAEEAGQRLRRVLDALP